MNEAFDLTHPATMPEPTPWNGDLPAETEPDPSRDFELERERRWADFIGACREFAASEPDGYAAVLRAVAEALKGQRELFHG